MENRPTERRFVLASLALVGLAACGVSRPLSVPNAGGPPSDPAAFTPYAPAPDPPSSAPGAAGMAGDAPSPDGAGQGGGAGFADPTTPSPAPPEPQPAPPEPPAPPPPQAPSPPTYCDSMPGKPLPYAIASDFTNVFPINATFALTIDPAPDCSQSGDSGATSSPQAPLTCFGFSYLPDECYAANAAAPDMGIAACWAGFIFSATPFTGVPGQGICIASGATVVRFKARATREGARVKFGSIHAGLGQTEFFLSLTTTWADYSVSIPVGEPYDAELDVPPGGVWNGFSIVVEPEDHLGGTSVFVSDVVWATM